MQASAGHLIFHEEATATKNTQPVWRDRQALGEVSTTSSHLIKVSFIPTKDIEETERGSHRPSHRYQLVPEQIESIQ